jgi:hypothetical protein
MSASAEAWWSAHYGPVERQLTELARQHDWLTPPLRFCATLREHYARLVQIGADADFVDRLLTVFAQDPRHRFIVMVRTGNSIWPNRRVEVMRRGLSLEAWLQYHAELEKAVPMLEAFERLFGDPSFCGFPPIFQSHVLQQLLRLNAEFRGLIVPIYEAWQHADADPLVRLLEEDWPAVRGRGRPSRMLGTAFMVLISRHLQSRTGRQHTRVVGEVTQALFPGAFAKKARKPTGWSQELCDQENSLIGIEERVRDRIRRFRYDVDALLSALS